VPASLSKYHLELSAKKDELIYTYDTRGDRTGITTLLNDCREAGISFNDLNTTQSSLEEIFVSLVHQ
jgi:ABC-2 type transport system ATP-binding protein